MENIARPLGVCGGCRQGRGVSRGKRSTKKVDGLCNFFKAAALCCGLKGYRCSQKEEATPPTQEGDPPQPYNAKGEALARAFYPVDNPNHPTGPSPH